MGFVLGFLGACIGIVAGVAIIVGVARAKLRRFIGDEQMDELVEAAKNANTVKKQEYARQKTVTGITNLIEPEIIRDFKEFNKEVLFARAEKDLRKILTALENKSTAEIRKDRDLIYIQSTIEDKINDMRGSGLSVRYDDIKFHNHAIKSYNKSKGRATIAISSTLEYYYDSSDKKFKSKDYKDIKRQTRYTTEYVYVYDESAFDYNASTFSATCPNCGAGIEFFGAGNCKYCGTYIEPINLKNWFIVSYKEDYKLV
jgi:hypothetical protein